MTSRIAEVSGEADQTGHRAADVHQDVAALATAVDDLRHSVIRVVRTSTLEVDRRQNPRYQVDLPCRLELAGGASHAARVRDLSEGGAKIEAAPAMRVGDRGTLRPDGFDTNLTFTVCEVHDGMARLTFTLDAAGTASFQAMLARLAQRHAA
jgi:methyl-accepting chemotaxis protein